MAQAEERTALLSGIRQSILLSEYKWQIEPHISGCGYKYMFHLSQRKVPGQMLVYGNSNLYTMVERFGPYHSPSAHNAPITTPDPPLRWFIGHTATLGIRPWVAFRNENDAIEFKLTFEGIAERWAVDV